jgi:deoxyribonuclease V
MILFMVTKLHNWNLTPEEAIRIQQEFRERLVLRWDDRPVTTIAGVDVSIKTEVARAAIVVLSYPGLTPIESSLAAWNNLQNKPDLLMFDGQGIAHPRGMGIASLMGLWLERPTIGVAKSRLFGLHSEVGPARGDRVDLLDKNTKVIGAVLRTREKTNPLYISPGHLMDVEHAAQFVMNCLAGYRLPEPTRWAHNVAGGKALPNEGQSQPSLF